MFVKQCKEHSVLIEIKKQHLYYLCHRYFSKGCPTPALNGQHIACLDAFSSFKRLNYITNIYLNSKESNE